MRPVEDVKGFVRVRSSALVSGVEDRAPGDVEQQASFGGRGCHQGAAFADDDEDPRKWRVVSGKARQDTGNADVAGAEEGAGKRRRRGAL